MDEDDVIRVVAVGGTESALLLTGLDMAMMNARGAFVHGRIEVDEFEVEVERILRKREACRWL